FDNSQETGQPVPEITIKKAIKYVAKAWDLVQPKTIINDDTNDTDDNKSIDNFADPTDDYDEMNQIQDLIDRLTPNIYENPISAKEYL
ncbi:3241_t:CDS:2, partial [Funneliformis mosseae]